MFQWPFSRAIILLLTFYFVRCLFSTVHVWDPMLAFHVSLKTFPHISSFRSPIHPYSLREIWAALSRSQSIRCLKGLGSPYTVDNTPTVCAFSNLHFYFFRAVRKIRWLLPVASLPFRKPYVWPEVRKDPRIVVRSCLRHMTKLPAPIRQPMSSSPTSTYATMKEATSKWT